MTIQNRDNAAEYYDAMGGKAGDRAEWVATVTDRLMGELVQGYEDAGLKFPNDDRCFNVELAVFKAAMSANRV